MLKSQDILVLLKLAEPPSSWTFDSIAHELGLSQSSIHRSLQRARDAELYDPRRRKVRVKALFEFLVHGLKYVFPAVWSGEARGYRTAWAAPPLSREIVSSGAQPVWPDAKGDAWGVALEPLHPSAPGAAQKDQRLAELLALSDALRIGSARERDLAKKELKKRLQA